MSDGTPQVIGKYAIIKGLGEGGQGAVYLAADPNLPSHRVILKVFKLNNPSDAERCRREADKLAQLESSPGFVGIKDFFQHGSQWVLVMPFLEGRSLADRLRDDGAVPVEEAVRIALFLLRALQTAHEKGIYHRDIKPANVMLLRGQDVKLIDFGLAKSVTDADITDTRMFMGSARYMAPEQFPPIAPDIDYTRVDIYQLGATLYNMLTVDHPYDEGPNELWELIEAKRTREPTSPRERLADLPLELERIILKAIAREPQARYASAAEMFAELAELARPDGTRMIEGQLALHPIPSALPSSGDSAARATPGAGTGAGAPGGRARSRLRWPLIAGVLAVVAAAIGLALFWPRTGERAALPPLTQPVARDTVEAPVVIPDSTRPTSGPPDKPPPAPSRTRPVTAEAASPPSTVTPGPAARGSLNVVSRPPLADIFLDNEYLGQTNLILEDLAAGNHRLSVSLEIDGKVQTLERIVRVIGGRTELVTFEFGSP